MFGLDALDTAFAIACLVIQSVLLAHFAVRTVAFEAAVRHGWLVYALSIPFAALAAIELAAGKPWWSWVGGATYLAWAAFGYRVEYAAHVEWRSPVRWNLLVPYVLLYLATAMLYWWPAAQLYRPLWFVLGALFVASSTLNVMSHRRHSAAAPSG